ncbi:MAG: hypothetical protein GX811_12200, partial [Lentisphaerae bacterium]|nr:hypothetical protein [Lentisphaerota bacterium]
MADIKITCVSCGEEFEVSDVAAGKNVFCPGCRNSVKVVAGNDPVENRLKLKKSRFCTECGSELSEDGV